MATISNYPTHQQPTFADAWTVQENKIFETALASHYSHPDRWNKVAAHLPGKTAFEIELKYHSLQEDIKLIEAGGLPMIDSSSAASQPPPSKRLKIEHHSIDPLPETAPEKRKGVPWSEEEHRLFLLGLAKFGKGDWRSISRHFVLTRTPTQVASHAQKYFIRLNSMKKDRKRASIHDITAPQQQLQQIKQQVRAQQLAKAQKQTQREQHKHNMQNKHQLQQHLPQQHELLLPPPLFAGGLPQHLESPFFAAELQQHLESPFGCSMVQQQVDALLPAVVPTAGDTSPYSETLLHTSQSDGVAEFADWACSLLLPNDPDAQMQMSKSMPLPSSFLLPLY